MTGLIKTAIAAGAIAGGSPALAAAPGDWVSPHPDFTAADARLLGMSASLLQTIGALFRDNGWVPSPPGAPDPTAWDVIARIQEQTELIERHLGYLEAETYRKFCRILYDEQYAEVFAASLSAAPTLHEMDWLKDSPWTPRQFKRGTLEWLQALQAEKVNGAARRTKIIEEAVAADHERWETARRATNAQQVRERQAALRKEREERKKKELRRRVQETGEYDYLRREALQERVRHFKRAYTHSR